MKIAEDLMAARHTTVSKLAFTCLVVGLLVPACSKPAPLAGPTAGVAATSLQGRTGAWRTLQLHTHSDLGGGNKSIAELIQMAADEGVDAMVISEHNDWRQLDDPAFHSTAKVTVIKGQEWGNVKRETPGGGDSDEKKGPHCNIINPTGKEYIKPSTQVTPMIDAATARGATLVINHPKLPSHEWPEVAMPDPRVSAVEVWNSWFRLLPGMVADIDEPNDPRSHLDHNGKALEWWDGLLRQGRKITAVGGSDFHRWPQPFATPINLAYAPTNSAAEHIAAIRAGHISIASSPKGPQVFGFADDGSGRFPVLMGDSLHGARGRFRTEVKNAKGQVVHAISRKGIVWEGAITSDTWKGEFDYAPAAGQRDYVRFEVRPSAGSQDLSAMSNPIYFE